MKTIKVGIVGARGRSTLAGFRAIEGVEVTAICDLNEEVLNQIGDMANIPKRYRVYEDMLESDIDAVVIATPMQLHVPQAVAAMEAGKHVLSEVTAGVTMDELWWLIEAKEKYNVTYMMAENYCYTPAVQLVGALRRAGLFGEPFYAEGEYLHDISHLAVYNNGKTSWRSYWQLGKRGSFYPTHSLGPVMHWFIGDRIAEISCFGTGGQFFRPELRQDELTVTMCQMASGALAKITVACKAPRPHNMHAYLLQGTKGCYEAPRGLGDDHKIWLEGFGDPDKVEWQSLWNFKEYLPERYKNPPKEAEKAGHQGGDYFLVQDFIDAIRTGEEPFCNVYRAAEWTAVGLLSEISVQNGGRAVSVPNFRKNMPRGEKIVRL
ncbi:MAG TPA: Gfo/Idh/MocA family oxidoreductase [Clostridiales bacterium]|nr:Gfo/Idh/MocA family oxidoreductase [Clostridiales bacterium]